MDSMGGMTMSGSGSMAPLDPNQFDLSNETQAADFLSQLLDDSVLQYDAQNYSRYFWYGIAVVIGITAIQQVLWKVSLALRKRAAAANLPNSAAPANSLQRLLVVITTMFRFASYPQLTPSRAKFWIQIPPVGILIQLALYFAFVLTLEFIHNDVQGAQHWTSLGVRAGWLAIAQMPLLILLAGKNNLIGLVTGLSYARLHILHRWVARSMLLMAILHTAYFYCSWHKYGISSLETSTDSCVPTGKAAFGLLIWLNISTLAPVRNLIYEVFVIQHLLTFFGFVVAIMYHLPSTALETRTYVWIPIGVWVFDRLIRTIRSAWNNSSQGRATVVSFDNEVTMVRVRGSRLRSWIPGSFVLLSIPHYGIAQSHPATIASTPMSHDGDLIFILRSHRGFTKNLLSAPTISKASKDSVVDNEKARAFHEGHRAFLDGPYGGIPGDMGAFDTVVLVAGSTGITFTLSILTDLSTRVSSQKLSVRRIELVWAIKRQFHVTWVSYELRSALSSLQAAGVETNFRFFVTGDAQVTDSVQISRCHDCRYDKSKDQNYCYTGNIETIQSTGTSLEHSQANSNVPGAKVQSGRPNMDLIISEVVPLAQGEIAVAVCGPLGLSTAVRRAAGKSIFAKQGIYLHVEGFSW